MSKVVFGRSFYPLHLLFLLSYRFTVGNVPYNMGEDQLIDVFKSVGQVVGFRYHIQERLFETTIAKTGYHRLVFDRETGKPRGYGFCEFAGMSEPKQTLKSSTEHQAELSPSNISVAFNPFQPVRKPCQLICEYGCQKCIDVRTSLVAII